MDNIKPEFVTDQMLDYLDGLRESGETNIYGARPYIAKVFPELNDKQAGQVLKYWIHSYGERHPVKS